MSIDTEQVKRSPYEMCSVPEDKVKQLALAPVGNEELRIHNSWTLTRTYPEKWRQDSSNMDPTYAWGVGSQMVCINYQTWDMGMRLNQAKFSCNGGCGYVLKPIWQCEREHVPAPMEGEPDKSKSKLAKLGVRSRLQLTSTSCPPPHINHGNPPLMLSRDPLCNSLSRSPNTYRRDRLRGPMGVGRGRSLYRNTRCSNYT